MGWPCRRSAGRAVLLAVALGHAGGCLPVAAAEDIALHRAALVDLARGAVYSATPVRTIEAIDLASGGVTWSSTAASVPLALQQGLVLARGEEEIPGPRVPVAVLDPGREGRVVFASTLSLPNDVRALTADEAGRSFRIEAWGADRAFVGTWIYREIAFLTMPPPPGESPLERSREGAFRVDTGRKHAEALEAAPLAPAARGPFRVEVEGGRGGALTLRRWDPRTGRRLADQVLLDKALLSLVSADGRHLLAVDLVATGGLEPAEYTWSIFALESGERVGEMRRPSSATPFVVWRDRLVFVSPPQGRQHEGGWVEEPLLLHAVKLPGGEPQWQRPLRDFEYRGALPPTP